MLIGYAYKEYLNKLEDKSVIYHIISLIAYTALFVFGITYKEKIFLVLMCGSVYGDIPLLLLNSLSGCGIVITISVLISKCFFIKEESKIKNAMLWIGKNTIGIYLVHKPFLQQVVVEYLISLGYSTFSFSVALLASIITFPISIGIVYLINKYVPSLFGRKANS